MDRSFPKISIVTASYNQSRFIKEAIESVISQGYPDFEHIIVDKCSDDGTVNILKSYRHLIWVSEPDRGQSDALNKGFAKAMGEIIGWLNADDLYLPDCFHTVAKVFNERPEADIIFGDYRWVDRDGKLIKIRRETDFDLFTYKYLHVPCFGSTAVFFKRRVFEENNYLDISFDYAMDYELLLRLATKGYRFVYARSILSDFRWHLECKSTLNSRTQIDERERALLLHDKFINNIYRPLRPLVRFILMVAARLKRALFKTVNMCKR